MAALYVDLLTLNIPVSATIAQYQAVTAAGAAAAAAGNAIGFAKIGGASGDMLPVQTDGVALAVAGGVIAPGALVEIHTTVTKVVTKSAGVAVGRYMGTANSADGDVIPVKLIPN